MSPRRGVLVVEDDPDMRFLLAQAMDASGYEGPVTFAEDGEQALEALLGVPAGASQPEAESTLPSLVFLDLDMPKTDGLEVLRRLRATTRTQTLPIVVLSRLNDAEDEERIEALGADEVRHKPHRFDELVRIISESLDRWIEPSRPGGSS